MLFFAVGLLVFASVLVAILDDWRFVGPALVLYFLALALTVGIQGGVAVGAARMVVGLAVVALLSPRGLRSRDVGLADGARRLTVGRSQQMGQVFRLAAVALAVVAAYQLALTRAIMGPPALNFAWYWLGAAGVLTLLLAHTPLSAGLGLFLLLGAAELMQTALGGYPDVVVLTATGLVEIVLALGIAHLSREQHPSVEGREATD